MSDPAETVTETEAPTAKPKPRRRRKQHRATSGEKVVPLKVPDEFAGMTETECCAGCKADRCVISGSGACAHPMKGGLQPAQMTEAAAMARFNRAKKVLAHRKVDLTNM